MTTETIETMDAEADAVETMTCEDCHAEFPANGVQYAFRRGRERDLCPTCYAENTVTCFSCDIRFCRGETSTARDGECYCENCYCASFRSCDDCGCEMPVEDQYGDDGMTLCESCYLARREARHILHYHSGTPLFFRGERQKHDRYIGFELEVGGGSIDDRNEAASELHEADEDRRLYWMEADSSIPDYGFELISQPMTLAAHRVYGWNDVCKVIKSNGLRAQRQPGCGLHIHVGRERGDGRKLSPIELAKIDIFAHRNVSFFEAVGRRRLTSYCAAVVPADNKWGAPRTRYCMLNLNPRHTIEFRFMQATLSPARLLGLLELCEALVNFIPTLPVSQLYRGEGLVDFRAHLSRHHPDASTMVETAERKSKTEFCSRW